MEIAIPAVPVGILVLLNFFAPYATAIVINPRWSVAQKKTVAIVVALVLALVVMIISVLTGTPIPTNAVEWVSLLILAVVVSQASYDLILKRSADQLAETAGNGAHRAL